jgi:hypothetical protein
VEELSPQGRSGGRVRLLLAAGVVVLVSALLGVGAYLIAMDSGEDLAQARATGRAAGNIKGEEEGRARGFKAGYKLGLKAGFASAYAPAYRRAYRAQFEDAELEEPAPREIKVVGP